MEEEGGKIDGTGEGGLRRVGEWERADEGGGAGVNVGIECMGGRGGKGQDG